VNVNKSTRYALYAAMEMAAAGEDAQVTAAQVAERYRIPASVVAKVFQQLVRAGIAVGTRGTGGGYQLAKKPSELTMLDVIQVFEPRRPPGECLLADSSDLPCPTSNACRLRMVFDEVDELVRCTFASITLETLVGKRTPLELEFRAAKA
jgi:Rrf2 family protein